MKSLRLSRCAKDNYQNDCILKNTSQIDDVHVNQGHMFICIPNIKLLCSTLLLCYVFIRH